MSNYSLSGIKKLYASIITGNSITYFISGSSIVVSDSLTFNELSFESANFNQRRISDTRGTYFQKEFSLVVPDISESSVYDLENENLVIVFEDQNCNIWITGHEKAYSLSRHESTTGGRENKIDFSLVQNSYDSIQPISLNSVTVSATTFNCSSSSCASIDCNCASGSTSIDAITGAVSLGGNAIYAGEVSNVLQFKGIAAGSNISITSSSTGLTISAISGITNSAANNELMKSNGTNAVGTGFYQTSAGILQLGNASLSGNRTIVATNSGSNASLTLNATGGVFITGAGKSAIGASSTTRRLDVVEDDGNSSIVTYPVRLVHTTNGTPSSGIGTGLEFVTETSSSNNEIGSTIESITTTVSSGSENFDLIFKTMSSGATASEKIRITSDGRLYGKALHNNTGSVAGATNQYVASGTYTPTLTDVANGGSLTPHQSQWIRVGNVVNLSGYIESIPAAATTLTKIGITFPIASTLGVFDVAGVASARRGTFIVGIIIPDTTNDRFELWFDSVDNTNSHAFRYSLTYLIN